MYNTELSISKQTYTLAREDEAFQLIREEYLDSGSENISNFIKKYHQLHSKMNIPTKRIESTTFRSLIKLTIDPIEWCLRKKGASEARKQAREINQKFSHRGAYFQAQNDVLHTPLALSHPITRNYIGTPKEYLSMNPMFRGIRGRIMDGSKRGENASLMIELLKKSILPNKHIDKMYGLKSSNPFWGMCIEEVFDAGPGANNKKLFQFCAQFHIGFRINQTATPWANAFIERFNDTYVRGYVSNLPGYMPGFKNSSGNKINLNKIAVIDPFQYEVIGERFINEYHNKAHSGLIGETPITEYHNYLQNPSSILMAKPVLPPLTDRFRDYCVPWSKESRIQKHKGIQIDNRYYGSANTTTRIYNYLKQRRKSPNVLAHIDHSDFSYIKITDPENNKLISIPFRKYDNSVNDDDRLDPGVSSLRIEMLEKYRQMSNEEIIDDAKRTKKDINKNKSLAIKRSTPEPIAHGRLSPSDALFSAKSVLHPSLIPPDLYIDSDESQDVEVSDQGVSHAEKLEALADKFGIAS